MVYDFFRKYSVFGSRFAGRLLTTRILYPPSALSILSIFCFTVTFCFMLYQTAAAHVRNHPFSSSCLFNIGCASAILYKTPSSVNVPTSSERTSATSKFAFCILLSSNHKAGANHTHGRDVAVGRNAVSAHTAEGRRKADRPQPPVEATVHDLINLHTRKLLT